MNIIQVYKLFPTEADCIAHLETVRWQGKPFCPYGSVVGNSTPMPKEQRHHCNACKTTFSVTIRTIFHHTHLPLQKWFLAVSLILNAKKGISARQLARDLEVNKSTAWRMGMQIRKAMAEGAQRQLLQGLGEMDETYVGGKHRKRGGVGAPKSVRGTRKAQVGGMLLCAGSGRE